MGFLNLSFNQIDFVKPFVSGDKCIFCEAVEQLIVGRFERSGFEKRSALSRKPSKSVNTGECVFLLSHFGLHHFPLISILINTSTRLYIWCIFY